MITLADVPVRRALLPELADRLVHAGSDDLASKLLAASSEHHEELALSIEERDELLAVLVDPPPPAGVEGLRDVLFADYEWRRREGL